MRATRRSGQRRALALLEAQYYRHLMFASCAWFFEDLDRIEPRNAIGYGLRALREAEQRPQAGPAHRLRQRSARRAQLRDWPHWRRHAGRCPGHVLRRRLWVATGAQARTGHDRPLASEPVREKSRQQGSVVVA